jgi:hypothetical protein
MVKADNDTEIVDLWKTNILKKSSENLTFEFENNGKNKNKNKEIENKNVYDKSYTQVIFVSYMYYCICIFHHLCLFG